MNSFKSQILTDERQMSDLIKLCDLSPNDKWSLLYRGTRDGSGSRDFHSRCDGHSNKQKKVNLSLVVIQR
jgi:hypothetical protein